MNHRALTLTLPLLTLRATMLATLLVPLSTAAPARADFIDHFATRADVGIYKVPHQGAPRVLVIPLIVEDLPFEGGSREAFLDEVEAFFDPATAADPLGPFSFASYFARESNGRYTPVPVVAAPVVLPTCPQLGAYADCAIPRGAGLPEGDVRGAIAVLGDALDLLDEVFTCASVGPGAGRSCSAGGGVDWPSFDALGPDGEPDGVVDGVLIVSNAGFPGIALPVRHLATDPLLSFFGPHPTFVYDGVIVGAVGIAGRQSLPQRSTYVAVHEFGHLLGFADLYNEAGAATDLPYTLMGGWFYADAGSALDAFSKMQIGWGHLVQASGQQRIVLSPASLGGPIVKVGTGPEFFLVEERAFRSDVVDGDLSVERGVAVWHVNLAKLPSPNSGSFIDTLSDCVNCTPFDALVFLEEADGELDLQLNRPRDDEGDLFVPGTALSPAESTAARGRQNAASSTNLLAGAATGITLGVSQEADGRFVLDVDGPVVDDPCAEIEAACGDQVCQDGVCGAPPVQAVEPLPACGCRQSNNGAPGFVVVVAAALALLRRRRALVRVGAKPRR